MPEHFKVCPLSTQSFCTTRTSSTPRAWQILGLQDKVSHALLRAEIFQLSEISSWLQPNTMKVITALALTACVYSFLSVGRMTTQVIKAFCSLTPLHTTLCGNVVP